jgi:hypothetical protein
VVKYFARASLWIPTAIALGGQRRTPSPPARYKERHRRWPDVVPWSCPSRPCCARCRQSHQCSLSPNNWNGTDKASNWNPLGRMSHESSLSLRFSMALPLQTHTHLSSRHCHPCTACLILSSEHQPEKIAARPSFWVKEGKSPGPNVSLRHAIRLYASHASCALCCYCDRDCRRSIAVFLN